MQDTTITLDDFIASHNLTLALEPLPCGRPDGLGDSFGPGSSHYRLSVTRPGGDGSLTGYYSTGSAIRDVPTLADILDCIASDVASREEADGFWEWADDLGFEWADGPRAQAAYDAIGRQADELHALLGGEAYGTLLYNVERQ